MGASLTPSGKKTLRKDKYRAMSDINVTPFVDVMLVLLITFMVAAPLLSSGVNVDLPKTNANSLNLKQNPIIVSIDETGEIFLKEKRVSEADLIKGLMDMTKQDFEKPIYIRGDRTISYGQIMAVMGKISGAGFKKISLVSETQKPAKN